MNKYLKVSVYTSEYSNPNGITATNKNSLYVVCNSGDITQEALPDNAIILVLKANPFSDVVDIFVDRKALSSSRAFGGAFVWSSDKRFCDRFPSPVPVYDYVL